MAPVTDGVSERAVLDVAFAVVGTVVAAVVVVIVAVVKWVVVAVVAVGAQEIICCHHLHLQLTEELLHLCHPLKIPHHFETLICCWNDRLLHNLRYFHCIHRPKR